MARPVDISDEAIIDVAQVLFLEKGIAATEMKDIAQRAKIGRSSLYRHFESKESIAFGIAGRILTDLTAVLEQPVTETETGAQELREVLERYAGYLHDSGFVVTFGSEHNTPAMEPIELFARGGVPLTPRLRQIGYEGACVVAAHQDIVQSGMQGYVDSRGVADIDKRDEYVAYGDKVIKAVIG